MSSFTLTSPSGLLSERPASGSAEGELFYATDNTTLYRWESGTWVAKSGTCFVVGGGGGLHASTHEAGGDDLVALGDLSGSLVIGQIPNDLITYAKLQNVSAADKVIGRSTAGAGDAEEIPCTAAGRALLDDVDAAAQRTTLGLAAIAASGSAADLGAGIIPDARMPNLTGDITTVEGAVATTLANNAVTLAKLLDIATASFLGRTTGGSGDPEVLTVAQATALLDLFTSALKGLVPASGGGTANFLRADGAWAAPGGSSPEITRIDGASGAAGADITWQKLAADAAANATTTLAVVMTTTGVGVGVWKFKYTIVYQAGATTTGVDFAINHTGTTGRFVASSWFVTSGGSAATAQADQVTSNTANLVEGKAQRTKNSKIGSSLGVDTLNADMLVVIEGIVVVTVSGSLELKHASEVAASTQVMADTMLELHKIE